MKTSSRSIVVQSHQISAHLAVRYQCLLKMQIGQRKLDLFPWAFIVFTLFLYVIVVAQLPSSLCGATPNVAWRLAYHCESELSTTLSCSPTLSCLWLHGCGNHYSSSSNGGCGWNVWEPWCKSYEHLGSVETTLTDWHHLDLVEIRPRVSTSPLALDGYRSVCD